MPFPRENEKDWYYIKDNKQVGPVSESKMQEMFDAGIIGSRTRIWSESLKDWTPAVEIKSFRVKDVSTAEPSKGMSPTRLVLVVLIPVVIGGMVLVLGVLAAIMLPALAKARESARRSACANNFKQVGLVLHMFATENNDKLPRIDDVKGNLMFEGDLVFPEYMTDISILGCPGDSGYAPGTTFRLKNNSLHPGSNIRAAHADCITCESYVYLGWMVTNEDEALAALEAYLDASVAELEEDLHVPEGKGTGGGSVIYRLRTGADRFVISDVSARRPLPAAHIIPVVWEWPTNHVPPGGNVLYLDGHVEFHRYPGKFPMTERFIEALRKMEPEFSGDVLPVVDK